MKTELQRVEVTERTRLPSSASQGTLSIADSTDCDWRSDISHSTVASQSKPTPKKKPRKNRTIKTDSHKSSDMFYLPEENVPTVKEEETDILLSNSQKLPVNERSEMGGLG